MKSAVAGTSSRWPRSRTSTRATCCTSAHADVPGHAPLPAPDVLAGDHAQEPRRRAEDFRGDAQAGPGGPHLRPHARHPDLRDGHQRDRPTGHLRIMLTKMNSGST